MVILEKKKKKKKKKPRYGRTDGRTGGRADGRTDIRTYRHQQCGKYSKTWFNGLLFRNVAGYLSRKVSF